MTVDTDEHIRPGVTTDDLAKLKPAFAKDGTVTAGNASGINDAAAAVVLADAAFAERHGHTPLGRLVAYSHAGVEPRIMGMGPAPAVRKVLDRAGMKLDQIDVIELNEAFAAQALAVARELGLDPDKTNPNGSGVSLGPPDRRHRNDTGRQGAVRAAPHRRPLRPGHHVHRRRAGHRRHLREGMTRRHGRTKHEPAGGTQHGRSGPTRVRCSAPRAACSPRWTRWTSGVRCCRCSAAPPATRTSSAAPGCGSGRRWPGRARPRSPAGSGRTASRRYPLTSGTSGSPTRRGTPIRAGSRCARRTWPPGGWARTCWRPGGATR